jgi:hypothetical protein
MVSKKTGLAQFEPLSVNHSVQSIEIARWKWVGTVL